MPVVHDNVATSRPITARMDADGKIVLKGYSAITAAISAYDYVYLGMNKDGWTVTTVAITTGTLTRWVGIVESALTTVAQVMDVVVGGPTYVNTTWAAANVSGYAVGATTLGAPLLTTATAVAYTGQMGQFASVRTTAALSGTTATYGITMAGHPITVTS